MRLLRTDTEELELATFNDEQKLPKYAILSHTWLSDEDEVSFADLASSVDNCARSGRKKLDFAKREAVASGYQYVWVDTCCIDKSSSAELAEAINSMFRWYRNAEICYVYLEDMPDDVELSEEPASSAEEAPHESETLWNEASYSANAEEMQDVWGLLSLPYNAAGHKPKVVDELHQLLSSRVTLAVAALKQCKWFTRGWTLQELIAPRHVRFFARSWLRPIGSLDRRSSWDWSQEQRVGFASTEFSRQISWITNIHEPVLIQEIPLEQYSIAQRMSWAAARTTTRIEDRAYCMLGIFDINMPIIYGEGGRAFERLQLEIIRSSPDQTIFAWESDARRMQEHVSLLAPYPDYFATLADLVRVPDREQGGHEVTSKGVRLCLPMISQSLTSSQNVAFGMLACRRKNDYTKAVALNLCSTLENNLVTGLEQHYYARGLVDLDFHEVTQVASSHVLIQLQQPLKSESHGQKAKVAHSAKIVFRCTGRGMAENDVKIASVAPLSSWSSERRAFEFQVFKPRFGQTCPHGTDVPWQHVPRMVDRHTKFGVHYEDLEPSSNDYQGIEPLLYDALLEKPASIPTPSEPRFAGSLSLTCGLKQCAILLVSAATVQPQYCTTECPEITPVYDFQVLDPWHDIDKHPKTRHHELKLNGPALSRRTLLTNGLLVSAEARKMLFLDQEVVLVEIKAMRLVSNQTPPLERSSTDEKVQTAPHQGHSKTAPRPDECDVCGLGCGNPGRLKRHMRIHHPSTRHYRCSHYGCSHTSRRSDKIKEHCYKHHGQARENADFTFLELPTEVDHSWYLQQKREL